MYNGTVSVGYMLKLLTLFPLFDIYKGWGGRLYAKTADIVPTFWYITVPYGRLLDFRAAEQSFIGYLLPFRYGTEDIPAEKDSFYDSTSYPLVLLLLLAIV